jgi:predicted flap endonuclease-1-like 5' DNA nuclease
VDLRERVDAGLETAGFEPADPAEPPEEQTPKGDESEIADGAPDGSAGEETAAVGDIIEDAEGGDGFADDRSADDSGDPDGSDDSVDTISGIGPAYAERLAEAGVETVGDLASADAASLADETDLGEGRVSDWIESARSG